MLTPFYIRPMSNTPSHLTQIRVRYSETDKMGYVYYGNHAQYFEVGRVELLRSMGIEYLQLEDDGILLPVRDLMVKYHAPAYYDQLLNIRTSILSHSTVSIQFGYRMENESGDLLAEGTTTLVFVDAITRKPRRAPEHVAQALASISST